MAMFLMDHVKDDPLRIEIGSKVLPITPQVVHSILGLPIGGIDVPTFSPKEKAQALAELRNLCECHGMKKLYKDRLATAKGPKMKKFNDLKRHEVPRWVIEAFAATGTSDDWTIKCFLMVLFNALLFPTCTLQIAGNEYLYCTDLDKVGKYDWCNAVVADIKEKAAKWKSTAGKHATPSVQGCVVLPLIYYLDNLSCEHTLKDASQTPRAAFFNGALVDSLSKADRMVSSDDKYITYGKLPLRNKAGTCYDTVRSNAPPHSTSGRGNMDAPVCTATTRRVLQKKKPDIPSSSFGLLAMFRDHFAALVNDEGKRKAAELALEEHEKRVESGLAMIRRGLQMAHDGEVDVKESQSKVIDDIKWIMLSSTSTPTGGNTTGVSDPLADMTKSRDMPQTNVSASPSANTTRNLAPATLVDITEPGDVAQSNAPAPPAGNTVENLDSSPLAYTKEPRDVSQSNVNEGMHLSQPTSGILEEEFDREQWNMVADILRDINGSQQASRSLDTNDGAPPSSDGKPCATPTKGDNSGGSIKQKTMSSVCPTRRSPRLSAPPIFDESPCTQTRCPNLDATPEFKNPPKFDDTLENTRHPKFDATPEFIRDPPKFDYSLESTRRPKFDATPVFIKEDRAGPSKFDEDLGASAVETNMDTCLSLTAICSTPQPMLVRTRQKFKTSHFQIPAELGAEPVMFQLSATVTTRSSKIRMPPHAAHANRRPAIDPKKAMMTRDTILASEGLFWYTLLDLKEENRLDSTIAITESARCIRESFTDKLPCSSSIIDFFVSCLIADDKYLMPQYAGYRVFVPTHVMDYITRCQSFNVTTAAALLGDRIDATTLLQAKIVLCPVRYADRWVIYCINLVHGQIDILDPSPWQSNRERMDYHGPIAGHIRSRLHSLFQRITEHEFTNFKKFDMPYIAVPKFEHPNDSAFLVMVFLEHYNPVYRKVTSPLNMHEVGVIRALTLYYMLFHKVNRARLPTAIERLGPDYKEPEPAST